jgi:hypothetical protein
VESQPIVLRNLRHLRMDQSKRSFSNAIYPQMTQITQIATIEIRIALRKPKERVNP